METEANKMWAIRLEQNGPGVARQAPREPGLCFREETPQDAITSTPSFEATVLNEAARVSEEAQISLWSRYFGHRSPSMRPIIK